ncbi:MAG: radical SAM protein [Kiritimatiellae bacterium]|nr:radical SAM protein [Kiritimatiellia bacterium]MDD5521312.1 radical SAM protein [Kiritimatiellia bacterium]
MKTNEGKEVLLVSPSSRAFNHYRPPLALMYLSGYLKHCGERSRIIDVIHAHQIRDRSFHRNMETYYREVEDEIVERVARSEADIVGITCYTPELDEVEKLARRFKSVKPGVIIIVGGIHPTLHPEHFFYESSPFDFAVVGEGEITLCDLVRAIRSKTELSSVLGIVFYDKNKASLVITERRPVVENLDDIAFPDYDGLDMNYYTSASPYSIRGVFTRSFYVLSSRGCPSSCVFCVSKRLREYHGARHYERLRSPNSLYNEIKYLQEKYFIDAFYFIDDLFTLSKDNVRCFCELLRSKQNSLIWGCSSKVNTVDYDILKIMRDAGCIQIDFGVEKGSDTALASLKKGITVKQIKSTFSNCRNLGIRTFANMLVNTPGENEKDLCDMFNLLDEIRPNIVSFNIFTPYPGCEIYDTFRVELERQQYAWLLRNAVDLVLEMPEKFRFASHSVDIGQWIKQAMIRYNRIWPNLVEFFDPRYIISFLRSRRKGNYIRQLVLLIREFCNQKF